MELRQLRYFVAVAEERNISRAARKIFLTQPALSRQIKALEEEMGQPLLERQANAIRLTPAGEALLREGRALLAQAEQLPARVRAASGVRLRVGYAPSLAAGLLSTALADFTRRHPQARVELADLSTAEMLAGLREETLDLAILARRDGEWPGLRWTPLLRSPWRLAVGAQHPLATRRRVAPSALAGEALLGFDRRGYPEYWERVNGWLRAHRLRPRLAGEYDGGESLMSAVAAGVGVALVTAGVTGQFPRRATYLTLADAPPPLCVAAVFPAARMGDKPLREFVEELRSAAAAAESGGADV